MLSYCCNKTSLDPQCLLKGLKPQQNGTEKLLTNLNSFKAPEGTMAPNDLSFHLFLLSSRPLKKNDSFSKDRNMVNSISVSYCMKS